jgi:pimeloyl-ACP methyl ester carboxylesterase
LSTGKSIDEQADAIAELLNYLSIPSIAVIAMSAGGMILYSLAIRYPHLVKSIVAIDAISGQYLLPEQASKWAQSFFMTDLGLWFTRESLMHFPEMTIKKFLNSSGSVNQELIDKKAKEIMSSQQEMRLVSEIMYLITDYHNRESGTMNDLHNGSKLESWFDFAKITAPALIVHGTHDNEVRFYHGVFAYEGLASPVKEKVWIEYGAHFGFYFKTQCGDAQSKLLNFLAMYA